jgi:hypothetical protein
MIEMKDIKMIKIGSKVEVKDAANLPCEVGDIGEVVEIRNAARDFPIGVRIGDSIEWFKEVELDHAG